MISLILFFTPKKEVSLPLDTYLLIDMYQDLDTYQLIDRIYTHT